MKIKNIIITIFVLISFKTYADDKIIFELEGNIYTTIDLNNRIKYLEIIGQNVQNKNKIYEDFKNVILFDLYAKKNSIEISKSEIEKYLNQIKASNNEKFIFMNLKYDLQKKTILENKLWEKNIEIKSKSINLIDIYNFKIEYITLEKKYLENLNKITKNQKKISFNNIKKQLDKNKTKYVIYKKNIKQLEKIDQKIIEKLKKKEEQFIIEYNDYILIGIVTKKLKQDIDVKLTFYQIIKNKIEPNKSLNCKEINKQITDSRFEIKKYEEVKINKLNNKLIENLDDIDDLILINIEENKENYILLCEIKFNENILNEKIYNTKLENIVKDIEIQLVNKIKNEFKIIEYE